MSSGNKKIIIGSLASLILVIAVAAAMWLISGDPQSLPVVGKPGGVNEITFQNPTTNIISGESISGPAGSGTTEKVTTEVESLVDKFFEEASTYEAPEETTTSAPTGGQKPFFHIVTDSTVTDSNSLEGLEGAAKTVGEIILAAGFRYDKEQGIFYSETDSWQRNFGFTPAYDAGAAFTGMYYDTLRLKFHHGGLDWMFQIWKGRYGITTGGEMGIYYKQPQHSEFIYACAKDDQRVTMSYALYRGDELFMTRGPEPHWWLTGFKIFELAAPSELTMHATYFMDDPDMADALEGALEELGFVEGINYQRLGLTMTIVWR